MGIPLGDYPMFKTIRCLAKGHLFVDSRSTPGTQVCVRCRLRKPFEVLDPQASEGDKDETGSARWSVAGRRGD